MAEPIRYYMDEHLPAQVTQGLRRLGIDVLTAQEAGRCGLPDPDQLAFATAEEWVMVTFDTDYLALHRAGVRHAGIAPPEIPIRGAHTAPGTFARCRRSRPDAQPRGIPVSRRDLSGGGTRGRLR